MYYKDAPFTLKVLEIQRRMSRPDSTSKSKTLYVRASLETRVWHATERHYMFFLFSRSKILFVKIMLVLSYFLGIYNAEHN